MYSFDASSIIHAWDNYPPSNPHFDSLWQWMAEQIENQQFNISKKAMDEVEYKIPECGQWLKENNIQIFSLTSSALLLASKIKALLDIEEENYTKGVGENDLLIIAIAKKTNTTLISEEGKQNKLPQLKSNYKIPAVCAMPDVAVSCISFVELLKQ